VARKPLTLEQVKTLAAPLAAQYGVPLPVVLAIAAHESGGFCGWATRGEPHLGDASIGLMQILYSTAKANGYTGVIGAWNDATNTGTGLYDPATNLRYGSKFFASLLKSTGNDLERAVSAYNAGLGNAKRVTVVTRFCLAWKATAPKSGRTLDRDCAKVYTAQPGEFGNQPYVNTIVSLARSYGFVGVGGGGAIPGGVQASGTPSTVTKPGVTYFVVSTMLLVAAAAVVGIVWMAQHGRKG
jgi:hypothetical protein